VQEHCVVIGIESFRRKYVVGLKDSNLLRMQFQIPQCLPDSGRGLAKQQVPILRFEMLKDIFLAAMRAIFLQIRMSMGAIP
jgi:hypothetical protein